MHAVTFRALAFWGLLIAVGTRQALGQPPETQPAGAQPPVAQQIINKQPAFLVAAEVNRPSREYREGDPLSLRVASEQDAFLYVYYQQADGKVFQIFPNRHRPNNQVKARQAV